MIAAVDGCRGGWLVATSTSWPCRKQPSLDVITNFKEVLHYVSNLGCSVVVVDMPIGLPEGPERRNCDCMAKSVLGKAHPRVFYAPPRELLDCDSPTEFQHRHKQIFGKGAGLPVWGIVSKLREVDDVMKHELQGLVFEFHPELAWRELALRKHAVEILPSKHKAEGINTRRDLLSPMISGIDDMLENRPRHTKKDDILDAVVGLSVAAFIRKKGTDNLNAFYARRIPNNNPARDERGLRMEIWF